MKFLCEKNGLSNAISIVSRTVSPKSSLAFLEGIYMIAGENLRLRQRSETTKKPTVCFNRAIYIWRVFYLQGKRFLYC